MLDHRADTAYRNILGVKLSHLGWRGKIAKESCGSIGELIALATKHNCKAIVLSDPVTLKAIVPGKGGLDNWRGAVLSTSIPILVTNPLKQVNTIPEGEWILDQDLSKLATLSQPRWDYKYEIATEDSLPHIDLLVSSYDCVVLDIETTRDNLMESCSMTFIHEDEIRETYVLDFNDATSPIWHEYFAAWMEAPILKVYHNGCFDCFYKLRYGLAPANWVFDTEYMWKCWHAELDKSLAFVSSICIHDYYYWKEEIAEDVLGYNAKDTINTARCFLYMIEHMPSWAWRNYSHMIPTAIPAIYCNFEGHLIDTDKREIVKTEAKQEIEEALASLQTMAGTPGFNPGSPKQLGIWLYEVLGAKKPQRSKSKSATDEVSIKKIALQHPLFARIVKEIIRYRKELKAYSTYYCADLLNNRLLYSMNIDGTETGRMSSSKSVLYVPGIVSKSAQKNFGAQAQNLPYYFKKAIMADPGYELVEIDKSQSEARCTAHLAMDEALRAALEDPATPEQILQYHELIERDGITEADAEAAAGDFYCRCAHMFFGLLIHKSHPVRQITKKIIHGTNYMMGAETFIDSVGIPEMHKAAALLNVAPSVSMRTFADELLSLYHRAYPSVPKYWNSIKKEIALTHKLITPDGWTREVFGNPLKNHSIWRAGVAHKPQHLSVYGINKAFWKVFYNVQIPSCGEVRMKGQVHDSMLQQVWAERREYWTGKILEQMDIGQPTGFGELRIPLDVEHGKYWKG